MQKNRYAKIIAQGIIEYYPQRMLFDQDCKRYSIAASSIAITSGMYFRIFSMIFLNIFLASRANREYTVQRLCRVQYMEYME